MFKITYNMTMPCLLFLSLAQLINGENLSQVGLVLDFILFSFFFLLLIIKLTITIKFRKMFILVFVHVGVLFLFGYLLRWITRVPQNFRNGVVGILFFFFLFSFFF